MTAAAVQAPAAPERERSLTPRQAAVFGHLYEATRRQGFQPSVRELGDHFGMTSENGVRRHMRALARKGWIRLPSPHRARAIAFLRRPGGGRFVGFTDCPGSNAAGAGEGRGQRGRVEETWGNDPATQEGE